MEKEIEEVATASTDANFASVDAVAAIFDSHEIFPNSPLIYGVLSNLFGKVQPFITHLHHILETKSSTVI